MSFKTIQIANESTLQDILSAIKDIPQNIQMTPKKTSYTNASCDALGDNSGIHAVLVKCNDTIYCINDNGTTLRKYNHTFTNAFSKVSNLPISVIDLHETSVVSYNNELHILGGQGKKSKLHYKWDGTSWTAVSELPFSFCSGKAIEFDGKLHIFGGTETTHYSTVVNRPSDFSEKHYAWDGSKWEKMSDYDSTEMTSWGATFFVFNNELHLIGGGQVDETQYNNQHWVWNKQTWTKKENLPFTIFNASATSYLDTNNEERVLVGCGNTDSSNKHRSLAFYTWDGTTFTKTYDVGDELTDLQTDSPYALTTDNDNNTPLLLTSRIFKFVNGIPYAVHSVAPNEPVDSDKNILTEGLHPVVFNDELYIFHNDGDIYKVSDDNSNMKPVNVLSGLTIRQDFYGAAFAVADDGIHVMGSDNTTHSGHSNYCRSHLVFNGSSWKKLEDLPFDFISGSIISYKGQLHAVGGLGLYSSLYNHYVFDNDEWKPVATTPRFVFGTNSLAIINDQLYGIGYDDDNFNQYKLMRFNGAIWETIHDSSNTSMLNEVSSDESYASKGIEADTRCKDKLLTYNDHIYLIHFKPTETNMIISYYDFMSSDGIISDISNRIESADIELPLSSTTNHYVTVFDNSLLIISPDNGLQSNFHTVTSYLKNVDVYQMYIPEGHMLICDKNDMYPIGGTMKETTNGYESIGMTHYVYADMDKDHAYTIY